GLLKGVAAWPAIISYYPHGSDDKPADYEMAYRLYANGVISQMSLIYPDFTLRADLVKLKPLRPACRAAL
ncbi:MAG: EipB family protein, partial [Steroidobacteraceae bacterium]